MTEVETVKCLINVFFGFAGLWSLLPLAYEVFCWREDRKTRRMEARKAGMINALKVLQSR